MKTSICVIGAGRWGRNHVRTLQQLNALGGIVESDAAKHTQLRQDWPEARIYSAVKDAIEDGYDGFIVATPAPTHFEVAKFLIERGKHLLVEKPIALTSEDARALRDLARKNNVNLMVGHVMLFHPAICRMKELLDQNKIGRMQYIYSNRLNLGTIRMEENILWSFAPHDLSVFQYLIEEKPVNITSRGGAFIQPNIHDTTLTSISYPNNIHGHIFVSWLHPFKEHRLVVIGSKGMFSFEDSGDASRLCFYEKGIDWIQGEPIKREGATEDITYDREFPLVRELKYFIEHLDGTPLEKAESESAVEVLEMLEAATQSLLAPDLSPGTSGSAVHAPMNAAAGDFFVHPTSFVGENVSIGPGTRVWHFSHIQSGAQLGQSCTLGQNVYVGVDARIGNHCKIQNNVSVYAGVTLEDYVFCGPSVVFTNVMYPRSKYPQPGAAFYKKTLVREGATLGANSTILCGITIGRHAMIGAGSVVTKDVPDYALMAGSPARRRGWVCECGAKLDDDDPSACPACPACSRAYRLADGVLQAESRPLKSAASGE